MMSTHVKCECKMTFWSNLKCNDGIKERLEIEHMATEHQNANTHCHSMPTLSGTGNWMQIQRPSWNVIQSVK